MSEAACHYGHSALWHGSHFETFCAAILPIRETIEKRSEWKAIHTYLSGKRAERVADGKYFPDDLDCSSGKTTQITTS